MNYSSSLRNYSSALDLLPLAYSKPLFNSQLQNNYLIPQKQYTKIDGRYNEKIPVERVLFNTKIEKSNTKAVCEKSQISNNNVTNVSGSFIMLPNGEFVSQESILVEINSDIDSNYKAFMLLTDLLKRYYALDEAYKNSKLQHSDLNPMISTKKSKSYDDINLPFLPNGRNVCKSSNISPVTTEQQISKTVPSSGLNPECTEQTKCTNNDTTNSFDSKALSGNLAIKTVSNIRPNDTNVKVPVQNHQQYAIPILKSFDSSKNNNFENLSIDEITVLLNESNKFLSNADLSSLLKLRDHLLPSLYKPLSMIRKNKSFKKLIVKHSIKPFSNGTPSYLRPTVSSLKMAKINSSNKS